MFVLNDSISKLCDNLCGTPSTPIMRNQPLTQGDKLALARKLNRPPLNQAELADLLGVTRSAVARWEVSEALPSKAIKLITAKLKVTLEWLSNPSDAPPSENLLAAKPTGLVSLAGTKMAPLPVVGEVAAGEGQFNVDSERETVFVPERLAQIGGIGWVVEGESMMPLLEPGDIAIFREHQQPRRHYPFLVKSVEGQFRVKTLGWAHDEWMLESLNPKFLPEALGSHALLGYLIGWYRSRGTRETMDSDPHGLRLDT